MELQLQQQKWEMEENERKQRLDLDGEEWRAFIDLTRKHIKLWQLNKIYDELYWQARLMHLSIE